MTSKPKGEPEDLLGEHKTESNRALDFARERHAELREAQKLVERRKEELELALSKVNPNFMAEFFRLTSEE